MCICVCIVANGSKAARTGERANERTSEQANERTGRSRVRLFVCSHKKQRCRRNNATTPLTKHPITVAL